MTTTDTSDLDRRLNDWFDAVEPRTVPTAMLPEVFTRVGQTGQLRGPVHRFLAALEQVRTRRPRAMSTIALVGLTLLLVASLLFAAFAAGVLPIRHQPLLRDGLIAVEDEVATLDAEGNPQLPYHYQIRFIDPVTGDDVFTTPSDVPSCAAHFSPDGSRYAFLSQDPTQVGTSSVSVLVANTGGEFHPTLLKQKDLQSFFHPAWAPDGSALAVIDEPAHPDETGAAMQLWVLPTDGSAPRQITDVPTSYSTDWSPSGDWIAFVGQGNVNPSLGHALYVIRPDGSDLRKLVPSGVEFVGWSPMQDHLAFTAADGKVHVVSADGREIATIDGATIGDGSDSGEDVLPEWSPDGTRIALAVGGQIKVLDVADGSATFVPTPWPVTSVRWSADGQMLLVSTSSADIPSIWIVSLDGSAPRFVADHVWTRCMSSGIALDWQRIGQ